MSEATIITPEQLPAIIPDNMDAALEVAQIESYEAQIAADAAEAARIRVENENQKALEAAQLEADQRVRAERDAAAKRETDRLAKIATEEAAERKRVEDEEHRAKIDIEAIDGIYECFQFEIGRDRITRNVVDVIFARIVAGNIPHISINY